MKMLHVITNLNAHIFGQCAGTSNASQATLKCPDQIGFEGQGGEWNSLDWHE